LSIQQLLDALSQDAELSRAVARIIEVPAREARYNDPASPLPGSIRSYLDRKGIRLYTHQAEVLERARRGENIVLTTATASGKSLAFALPVLEEITRDPGAAALFLYPMKALAYDQLTFFQELEKETGIAFHPAVYDGDTPQERRREIREESGLILTNPHALHRYLSWHKLWRRFFRNLKYVIVDEAHWYRGLFGAHVAWVLRRLRRILAHYGSHPQFILASATMASPAEHAAALTGLDFSVVDDDGSASGKKTFVFWDASALNWSEHLQAAALLALCVREGLQTILFAPSRKMAELYAAWAGQKVNGVAAYRAGYLPEARRDIERKLKSGDLSGVAATNALELGVDIGGLDAAVLAGWPGTVASFRQQVGRAGRARQESLAVQVFFSNPLDGYFLRHPEQVFRTSSEQAVVALENKEILKAHLKCAAEELPLVASDGKYFGPGYINAVKDLIREGGITLAPGAPSLHGEKLSSKRYVYVGAGASSKVSLSAFDHASLKLVNRSTGEILEILGLREACRDAHPGAIYLHGGDSYRVVEFRHGEGLILAEPAPAGFYTQALVQTDVKLDSVLKQKTIEGARIILAEARVSQITRGYLVKKYDQVISKNTLSGMPPVKLSTVAICFRFDRLPSLADPEGGLHAAEHVLIAAAPLLSMCDRWDIGGLAALRDRSGLPSVYVYDSFPGGAGIASSLYGKAADWTAGALELLRSCGCIDGCPRCILSPKCGNGNEPLHKSSALAVLKSLARAGGTPGRHR